MSIEAEHVLVCGSSGGGKTTYLRELHARHDGPSIFLTTKAGETTALYDPPHRIRQASCEYPREIQKAREWAKRHPETVQVIIDEVDTAPTFLDGENGPVRKLLHDDRSDLVKTVIATQNPQDLRNRTWNYGPLQQCQYVVWVGPAKTWHTGFTDWLQLDNDQLPNDNYQYHVIKPSAPPEVVHRGETKQKYG